ncbi:MAG: DNA primase, partial [bacterium]
MTPQEQIKEKLDLVDFVSGYLTLKPAGGENFKGVCPFHNEKTASLFVSRDKQLWHCFGCSEGGDLFAFIMKLEGLDFNEALRALAEKAGVEIPRFSSREANEKTRLLELLRLAEKYYRKVYLDAKTAEVARDYVKRRVIPADLEEQFGVGYSPEGWDSLSNFLKQRGFKEEEIVKAGLAVRRTSGSGIYDRFRGRLMFPIRDYNGKTVGFTGRILKPDAKEAKYVNTPQTLLYDKSAVLYGLDLARGKIRDAGEIVIVEGQMDVIGSWRGGVGNVVASSGTALTERQVAILKRYSPRAALAFDADAAGLAAARRGVNLLLAAECDVKIITLPPGVKDPDECTVKNPELWQAAIQG